MLQRENEIIFEPVPTSEQQPNFNTQNARANKPRLSEHLNIVKQIKDKKIENKETGDIFSDVTSTICGSSKKKNQLKLNGLPNRL